MIDFTTLQGLTIPEGVVTQITDESGRVIWAVQSGEPIVLEVAKQTLTTYAGETEYADESFILLDIYPKKSNSIVEVTYGGLTKTLTFSGTNAQQVYFGTFNGVSDEIATAASGTLTIEGGCKGFACGVYQSGSKTINKGYCGCITDVVEWGGITSISNYAFYNCTALALTSLPSGITSIGTYAFYGCTALALTSLPSGITSIGTYAFYGCTALALTSLPSGITSIGSSAFYTCSNIAISEIPEGVTSIESETFYMLANKYDSDGNAAGGANTKMPTNITLPSTLKNFNATAFAYRYNSSYDESYIQTLIMLATTPPTLSGEVSLVNIQIIVPKGCGDAYKTAEGWSQYADEIVEAS